MATITNNRSNLMTDPLRNFRFLVTFTAQTNPSTAVTNLAATTAVGKPMYPKPMNDTFVDLYFEILFFDAKTGVVRNLINTPNSGTLSLQQFNANPSWRFAKVKLLNPYFDLPGVGSLNRLFKVEPINGNSDTQIRFTELILQ